MNDQIQSPVVRSILGEAAIAECGKGKSVQPTHEITTETCLSL